MKRGMVFAIVAMIGLSALPFAAAEQPAAAPDRSIAITFDDLPFVQRGVSLDQARRMTDAMLQTLRRHGAPAVGFVNEGQLETDRPARLGLLQAWIDAGMTLGNHTYSHPDLNRVTIERFQDEIVRGERSIRSLQPQARLLFRHPMTHTGDTRAKKDAIDGFLTTRGYVIAPHTVETADFIFNGVFSSAMARGDAGLAAKVTDAYLDHSLAATGFAERISREMFGREISQVLLIHANELNGVALDDLLRRYRDRGYRFVTLEQAMTDPVYRTPDTFVGSSGPTWLWRWRQHLKLTASFSGDPEPPAWVTALFNAK